MYLKYTAFQAFQIQLDGAQDQLPVQMTKFRICLRCEVRDHDIVRRSTAQERSLTCKTLIHTARLKWVSWRETPSKDDVEVIFSCQPVCTAWRSPVSRLGTNIEFCHVLGCGDGPWFLRANQVRGSIPEKLPLQTGINGTAMHSWRLWSHSRSNSIAVSNSKNAKIGPRYPFRVFQVKSTSHLQMKSLLSRYEGA